MRRVVTPLLLVIGLFFYSCSKTEEKPLKISATTWIGYTPLFYAKQKGWLDELNIKLLHVVSLSENMYMYKSGISDAYVGTQYEYGVLKNKITDLTPIMLFDRSDGGDIIMSNASLLQLQKSDAMIDTYLEIDSINHTLLQDFIHRYGIRPQRIRYINRDQTEIALLKNRDKSKLQLIVTYIPYDSKLLKNGYQKILSTKESLSLLVVDAMFTSMETFVEHKEQFMALKKLMDKSVEILEKDPKDFYITIKPYMENMSYGEFQNALKDIKWVNRDLSKSLKDRMSTALFPTKDLL